MQQPLSDFLGCTSCGDKLKQMANPLFDLTGKLAILSGSSRRLGLWILREEGCIVYGYALDIAHVAQVVQSVKAIEGEVGPYH